MNLSSPLCRGCWLVEPQGQEQGVPGWDSWDASPQGCTPRQKLHPQREAAPPYGGCTTALGGNRSKGQPLARVCGRTKQH